MIRYMTTGPRELPEPHDDGAADHLAGRSLPSKVLASTDGRRIRLNALCRPSVIFVHPAIGGPGREDRLVAWSAVPGARGCTPEACGFRDELAGFHARGFDVYGLSNQPCTLQREHAGRLGLRYPLLSDESMQLADKPGLPTFTFDGHRYYRRVTLLVTGATIDVAIYPVFPPEQAAAQALRGIAQLRA